MKLNDNGSSNVPLVNTDPLGGEFGGISDSDIARIDSFVNNSGLGGGITYVPADTYGNYLFTFALAGIPKTVTELELGFNPFTATSETDFTMGGQVNFTVRVN